MEIIAAPADPDFLEEPKSLEEFAFNPAELSDIAAQLLRQMLELYGQFNHTLLLSRYFLWGKTTACTCWLI